MIALEGSGHRLIRLLCTPMGVSHRVVSELVHTARPILAENASVSLLLLHLAGHGALRGSLVVVVSEHLLEVVVRQLRVNRLIVRGCDRLRSSPCGHVAYILLELSLFVVPRGNSPTIIRHVGSSTTALPIHVVVGRRRLLLLRASEEVALRVVACTRV